MARRSPGAPPATPPAAPPAADPTAGPTAEPTPGPATGTAASPGAAAGPGRPSDEDAAPGARHARPAWVAPDLDPLHDDLAVRVVLPAEAAEWHPSPLEGVEVRVLEHLPGPAPRTSAQLRLAPDTDAAALGAGADLELLVQHGELEAGDDVWSPGLYARLPVAGEETSGTLTLRARDGRSALLYAAAGHIVPSDTERRRIDTTDASRWLPGPVEGTEVLALHGHGSGSVMLIRWLGAVAFRPRLDPLGEEVLVLEGRLHDADGTYAAGSWIRNPVPAWQSWSGDPGTLVYYKNGHFATAPDESSLPFPTA